MGWGKTFLAGLGGFVVGGPVGAALAAGAVHAGSKIIEASKEDEKVDSEKRNNDTKRDELMRQREQRLEARKAKEQEEKRRLQEERQKAEDEVNNAVAQKEQFLVALLAVGIATASVDGPISADEKHELDEALKMAAGNELPAKVQARYEQYLKQPPTFMQAKKEVCKLDNPDNKLFRTLVESIVHSDNEVSEEEEDFLEKWNYFFPEK